MSDTKKDEKKVVQNYDVLELEFNPPYEYEGKKYEKLTFNFAKLKGRDYMEVKREMNDNGEFMAMSASHEDGFLYRFAAKAAGIGSDVLLDMPGNRFNEIVTAAKHFLIRSES